MSWPAMSETVVPMRHDSGASMPGCTLCRHVLIEEEVSRKSTPIGYDRGGTALIMLGDRFQMQQAIVNLVGDAIEARQDRDRAPIVADSE